MDYNITEKAQETFKNKNKPKTPFKFTSQLNEEQKQAKNTILNNDVIAIKGSAGSGKSYIAIMTGLDLLFKKEIEKIIVARPYVTAGEDIGFLPGGVDEKLSYLTSPIYNIMYEIIGKEKTDKLVNDGKIMVLPFGFLRGFTLTNSYVLIDEAQNATLSQTELMLGRLGKNSKMVFCGDMSQCDLKNKKDTGFDIFKRLETNINKLITISLNSNHRHPIVEEILTEIKKYKD
jgi:phosphate starvation-inducible PhoH-like protein